MRSFPILSAQKGTLRSIPWNMIAPHEQQAKTNHCGQTLERLAERGGLSYAEAIAILTGKPWNEINNHPNAETELTTMIDAWNQG